MYSRNECVRPHDKTAKKIKKNLKKKKINLKDTHTHTYGRQILP